MMFETVAIICIVLVHALLIGGVVYWKSRYDKLYRKHQAVVDELVHVKRLLRFEVRMQSRAISKTEDKSGGKCKDIW